MLYSDLKLGTNRSFIIATQIISRNFHFFVVFVSSFVRDLKLLITDSVRWTANFGVERTSTISNYLLLNNTSENQKEREKQIDERKKRPKLDAKRPRHRGNLKMDSPIIPFFLLSVDESANSISFSPCSIWDGMRTATIVRIAIAIDIRLMAENLINHWMENLLFASTSVDAIYIKIYKYSTYSNTNPLARWKQWP